MNNGVSVKVCPWLSVEGKAFSRRKTVLKYRCAQAPRSAAPTTQTEFLEAAIV